MDLEGPFFFGHCIPPIADGGDTTTGYSSPPQSRERGRGQMGVMMTGQQVGMVIRPPTGGGLPAVEVWRGRCASRHVAQAGGSSGDIGRPAEQIWMTVVMFSSFNLSFHRRPVGRAVSHGGISNQTEVDDAAPAVRRAAWSGGFQASGLTALPEIPLNSAGRQRERVPPRDEASAQGGRRSPVPST